MFKKQAKRAYHYSAFQFFLVDSGHKEFTARLKLAPRMLLSEKKMMKHREDGQVMFRVELGGLLCDDVPPSD